MATSQISIGSAKAERGRISFGKMKVAELNDSSPIDIPIAIVQGQEDGPVLWVQNGVHGDEYVGLGAIQWLLRDLDPMKLRGTVIAIPVVNIMAYRERGRMASQDGLDMNRMYPGKPLETAMHLQAHTELVLHTLTGHMQQFADCIIDCHDGSSIATMSPYAQYYDADDEAGHKSRELCKATGMSIVWRSSPAFIDEKAPGSLKTYIHQIGIPGMTLEVGGQGRLDRNEVARMNRALRNCLVHLGMIEGNLEIPGEQVFISKAKWLRPESGGTFWANVEPLQRVAKGDLFATVTDLFGREKERLLAPTDGIVVGVRTHGTVHSGEYCGNVAELEDLPPKIQQLQSALDGE